MTLQVSRNTANVHAVALDGGMGPKCCSYEVLLRVREEALSPVNVQVFSGRNFQPVLQQATDTYSSKSFCFLIRALLPAWHNALLSCSISVERGVLV